MLCIDPKCEDESSHELSEEHHPLQFVPFSSFVDPSFWSQLCEFKLGTLRLNTDAQRIWGHYTNTCADGISAQLHVDYRSIARDTDFSPPASSFVSHGVLHLMNTLDDFKALKKQSILESVGSEIWADIVSGRVISDASLLSRFVLIAHIVEAGYQTKATQDIKRYIFYYWFAYPALCFPFDLKVRGQPRAIGDVFKQEEIVNLRSTISEFTRSNATGYFVVHAIDNEAGKTTFKLDTLSQLTSGGQSDRTYLAFCDPATQSGHPGWTLRNLLAVYAHYKPNATSVSVLCWRNRFQQGVQDCTHSIVLDVNYSTQDTPVRAPDVVGFEKNDKGVLAPRMVNLSSTFDPKKLIEKASRLNLQLMKWRLVPELDLKRLSDLRVLLLGSGTLGSNIARSLLGWGIDRLTFVDNGRVSFSNPVRQSLFQFSDCLSGGECKSSAAVQGVKRVLPLADVRGEQLTIPMPGHVVSEADAPDLIKTVQRLDALIANHDIVFLLTDTRESRWLPTLICAHLRKNAFSVALGYDSYVCIRHGFGTVPTASLDVKLNDQLLPGSHLACYFCCDVTAPGDSTRDRTLDQECTVTRPGVSLMASAVAVETMVSMMQHPDRALAPAALRMSPVAETATKCSGPLGAVPHQVRGSLVRFDQFTPAVQRFSQCVACSQQVVTQYAMEGANFVQRVCNDSTELERLSGLSELQIQIKPGDIIELSDDESV